MTTQEAVQLTIEQFPFKGYMTPGETVKGAYLNIANTVVRYLPTGSKILDFGSGPCDKTAVLQLLGYHCFAYDDLQDDWHQKTANREKILSFIKECGINFTLATDHTLPFEKNFFDMVMLHDVLEHLHDSPRDLLNDLLELLKPEGFLFITVPNAVNIRKRINVLFGKTNLPRFQSYYWHPGPWRGHIREYVKNDLIKLSHFLNLEIVEIRSCDHMLEKLPGAIRPAYHLLTNLFGGWRDSWVLVARKKQGWVPKKALTEKELSQIFPRLSL